MEDNRNRAFLAFILVVAVSLFAVSFASADIVNPANGGTVAGNAVLVNSTNASLPHMVNCTFYAISSSTANNTWVQVSPTIANTSANQPSIANTTVLTSLVLEDASNYQFNATCANNSNTYTSTVTTASVTIDNTAPRAPSSLSPTTTDTDGSVTFSATVTARNTTACLLIFSGGNPGSVQYSSTHSGSNCTNTITAAEGTYTYLFQASDGTNRTNSSTQRFSVDVPTSAGAVALIASQKNVESIGGAAFSVSNTGIGGLKTSTIAIIVGVAAALGVLWFLLRRS